MTTWFQLWKQPYLPQEAFILHLPDPSSGEQNIKRAISALEQEQADWAIEEEKRLRAAMLRIRLCAFLRGMTSFGSSRLHDHYAWCPYEAWRDQTVGRITWDRSKDV